LALEREPERVLGLERGRVLEQALEQVLEPEQGQVLAPLRMTQLAE
jgi:hypothetical protein